jgi:hypothetical protein
LPNFDEILDECISTIRGDVDAVLGNTHQSRRLGRKAAGVSVLIQTYTADSRQAALVQFPGGYIAEIHSLLNRN